jgi:uncharacterized protein (TIGR03032 family)
VWRLENVLKSGQIANKQFDRLYVPRNAHTTGDLDIHEIAVDATGRVVFVNTKYSCLATLDPVHSFKPLWRPDFVSKLAPEDRCHLNGLAMLDGRPKYMTAVSRSDVVDGWRERRHEGGVIFDIEDGRAVTEDLSMPHSPRVENGALWVLDSGRGYLCRVDQKSGAIARVTFCPGFLRGLSFFATSLWLRPLFRATTPSRGWRSRSRSRRATRSPAAVPILSTRGTATFCIGSDSRAACANCSTWDFYPACGRRCAWGSRRRRCGP